jgi:carbon monoxide dehydrogenase subunit G
MTYEHSLHIEAPVATVFDFFRDPSNWAALAAADGVEFIDVVVTREGVGTHYAWRARLLGLRLEGLNVFTDVVPDRLITDRSSSSLEGTWSYRFEPEGAGTRLTVENRVGATWLRPFERLLDRVAARTHEPRFAALKAMLEQ